MGGHYHVVYRLASAGMAGDGSGMEKGSVAGGICRPCVSILNVERKTRFWQQ